MYHILIKTLSHVKILKIIYLSKFVVVLVLCTLKVVGFSMERNEDISI